MAEEKELFRTRGKVLAPDNLTKSTILKINRRITSKELLNLIFFGFNRVFVFFLEALNMFFKPKRKPEV
jgi:hypothetical protein